MSSTNAKNLLLISLDTTRADVAYSSGNTSLSKLRSKGVTFLNTIAPAPLTPISHSSVFTGLNPYNHGVRHLFREKLSLAHPTLAEILRTNGFETGAVVSCPGMNSWYGFSRGFNYYNDEIPKLADGTDPLQSVDVKIRGTALKRAPIVVDRALEWANSIGDERYFMFAHFFDAHWPYEAPQIFGGGNHYEQEVHYSLHYMGRLLDGLDAAGKLEDTMIICFSDHGEDLSGLYPNDKGGDMLGHPEENGHGCLLYDQTQKVVLVMAGAGIQPTGVISEQVRLIDIAPTALNLLGVSAPVGFDGVSLSDWIEGRRSGLHLPAYMETMYPDEVRHIASFARSRCQNKIGYRIDNRYKLIHQLGDGGVELYDLLSDPNEQTNIWRTGETLPVDFGRHELSRAVGG